MKNPNIDRWKLYCKRGWSSDYCPKGGGKIAVNRHRRNDGKKICRAYLKGDYDG